MAGAPAAALALLVVDDWPGVWLPWREIEPEAPIPVEDWPLEPCAAMLPEDVVSERNASLPLVDEEDGDCDWLL